MNTNAKHGHWRNGKKTPTYRAWDNMIQLVARQ
jgi:hypothetical protein